ncbi:hypothetical protein BDK51DRAFT_31422, partial [Blyttiomyces helicus]
IPRLMEDIVVPDYCFMRGAADVEDGSDDEADVITNAWFGPRGTVSPLHTDPHHNLFAQVVGEKYVRLYPPSETQKVYPHEEAVLLGNTSQVDVESPDLAEFPLFATATYLECVVEPGDLLFISVGWWHYVRSLSLSFSVSFWF